MEEEGGRGVTYAHLINVFRAGLVWVLGAVPGKDLRGDLVVVLLPIIPQHFINNIRNKIYDTSTKETT